MKIYLSVVLLLFSLSALQAQKMDTDLYFGTPPRFNGDVSKYITDHINTANINFDSGAIQTCPVVRFTVEKDGSISSVKIIYASMPMLDSAIVKCIRELPKWQPGIVNGKPVGATFQMPIRIDLR